MVTRYAGDKFTALSSDTFPTNVADGATLHTLDTFQIYTKQSNVWNLSAATGLNQISSGNILAKVNTNNEAFKVVSGSSNLFTISPAGNAQITGQMFVSGDISTNTNVIAQYFTAQGSQGFDGSIAVITSIDFGAQTFGTNTLYFKGGICYNIT